MMNAIVVGMGIIWLIYKWVVQKKVKYIVTPFILFLLQLSMWPFFLKIECVFGILSLMCGVMLSLEYCIKKRIDSIYPYIIVFTVIGLWLLGQFFLSNKIRSISFAT